MMRGMGLVMGGIVMWCGEKREEEGSLVEEGWREEWRGFCGWWNLCEHAISGFYADSEFGVGICK